MRADLRFDAVAADRGGGGAGGRLQHPALRPRRRGGAAGRRDGARGGGGAGGGGGDHRHVARSEQTEHEARLQLADHVYIGPFCFIEASGGVTIGVLPAQDVFTVPSMGAKIEALVRCLGVDRAVDGWLSTYAAGVERRMGPLRPARRWTQSRRLGGPRADAGHHRQA